MSWGEIAQARLADIAACSLASSGVTRLPFTDQHREAIAQISDWMVAAGLSPTMDAAGTLVGHKPGQGPALLIGSHQDTVRDAGPYDGVMGVALACLAIEKLSAEGYAPPFPIDVLAFADEEGVRFPTALLGPRALAGTVDSAIFALSDADGTTLGEALRSFDGDPDQIATLARDPADVRGYLEVHIEQGPVLENSKLALGVVTGICGIERNSITFKGETGHAGTVPMQGRADALVAASEFIAQVHDAAPGDVRATVGAVSVHPGVVNAIPDQVDLTLEIRDISDATRTEFARAAEGIGLDIAARRGCDFLIARTYVQPAVPCNPDLMVALSQAVIKVQGQSIDLPSGATHDASAMADLCPVGMLFLRCTGGISHRPDEHASAEDMGLAIDALAEVLRTLD